MLPRNHITSLPQKCSIIIIIISSGTKHQIFKKILYHDVLLGGFPFSGSVEIKTWINENSQLETPAFYFISISEEQKKEKPNGLLLPWQGRIFATIKNSNKKKKTLLICFWKTETTRCIINIYSETWMSYCHIMPWCHRVRKLSLNWRRCQYAFKGLFILVL